MFYGESRMPNASRLAKHNLRTRTTSQGAPKGAFCGDKHRSSIDEQPSNQPVIAAT